jgi:hypothetical protein
MIEDPKKQGPDSISYEQLAVANTVVSAVLYSILLVVGLAFI